MPGFHTGFSGFRNGDDAPAAPGFQCVVKDWVYRAKDGWAWKAANGLQVQSLRNFYSNSGDHDFICTHTTIVRQCPTPR